MPRLVETIGHARAAVWTATGQKYVQTSAEQKNVRTCIDFRSGPPNHFGRHIGRCACDATNLVHRGYIRDNTLAQCDGESPVDDIDFFVAADHYVLRFDVAVNDPAPMCEMNGSCDLNENPKVPFEGIGYVRGCLQWALEYKLAPRSSAYAFHNESRIAL